MEDLKKVFAGKLLGIKAIKLQPNDPFTWASGWKSPFYCDNRKTLSYHDVCSFVKLELVHAILENFPEATAVAGVATGAIAQGMLVAQELALPYAYVRPKPKDHGMKNQIEGEIPEGAKVVVVEDFNLEAPKTKDFVNITKNLKVDGKKVLLVLPEVEKSVYLSARNLKKAEVMTAAQVNSYKVLNADVLVVTENSLKVIDEILTK